MLVSGQAQVQWTSPYLVTQLFPHGEVELETKAGMPFKVNGKTNKNLFLSHPFFTRRRKDFSNLSDVIN